MAAEVFNSGIIGKRQAVHFLKLGWNGRGPRPEHTEGPAAVQKPRGKLLREELCTSWAFPRDSLPSPALVPSQPSKTQEQEASSVIMTQTCIQFYSQNSLVS